MKREFTIPVRCTYCGRDGEAKVPYGATVQAHRKGGLFVHPQSCTGYRIWCLYCGRVDAMEREVLHG